MLDASKSKGCAPLVRLHAACMAIHPFARWPWSVLEKTQPRRLRTQVGRVAFKRRVTPLKGNHVFALPSCIASFHLPSPRMGNTRGSSALSLLEEHNFMEVGTFQPSFGFKDFHQAARLRPLAGGHPRR
jgi:hypothetical protein